jgi:hypothetical protein
MHILRPELFFYESRGFRELLRPSAVPNFFLRLSAVFSKTHEYYRSVLLLTISKQRPPPPLPPYF